MGKGFRSSVFAQTKVFSQPNETVMRTLVTAVLSAEQGELLVLLTEYYCLDRWS